MSESLLARALYDRRVALDRITVLEGEIERLRVEAAAFLELGSIDEERLARACGVVIPAESLTAAAGQEAMTRLMRPLAAAIAKAYREDTDDRP